jgi:hypothetical protein
MDELASFPPVRKRATDKALRQLFASLDWPAALALVLPFLLYLHTMAPTVYNLDSAELTTAAATGGILRATGYPLYLALGWLWSHLPVGDVGFRLNLFSAFCAALTILLLELSLRRLRVGLWARLGALGLLASAPYFWAMSLIAEVYTLHTALLAGILLATLRWRERPTAKRLALVIFLLVLSFGNHAATVLLVPGLAWFLFATAPRRLLQGQTWRLALPAALLAACVFLYLPLRYAAAPAFNYAGQFDAQGNFIAVNLQTLHGFLWLVTGRSFAAQMFGYNLAGVGREIVSFAAQLWQAFFAVGIGPGLLGMLLLWKRDRRLGEMLLLLFGANVAFYVNYHVVDKNTMYLPAYVIWALWLALGLQELWRWTHNTRLQQAVRWFFPIVALLAVAWNWQHVDLSGDWSARQQGEEILQNAAPDAIILGWWDTVPVVQYLQLVEGRRPDVLAINRFLISGENFDRLVEREAGQRPIYVNAPPPEFLRSMRVEHAGPLYRLYQRENHATQEDNPR